jgi:DNA-binding HxlR family transcriptional regulator
MLRIDRFEHFLQPSGREAPPLCYPSAAPSAQMQQWPRETTVNQMVNSSPLDRTFSALSDATRRHILERLAHGPATLGELARPFHISLPGLMKHVRVLEEAHLVTTEKKGRTP